VTQHPHPTIQKAIERYVELELEIDRLCTARFGGTCGACGGLCCRANHAAMTLGSWWLRQVSVQAQGQWWPEDWATRQGCCAQTPTGCVLHAGRPVCCWSWLCEPLVRQCVDVWEVVFYGFVSELPGDVARLTPSADLLQMSEGDIVAVADRVAGRVEEAHRMLAAGRRLLDPAVAEVEKARIALRLICQMPRILQPSVHQALLENMRTWGWE
jgi:hypothetical protein